MVPRSSVRRGLLIGVLGLAAAVPAGCGGKGPHAAVRPVPRPQAQWRERHRQLRERAREGGVDVLFLGDSITHGWEVEGKEVWAEHFAPLRAANFGMSSDRTQHVLWRITEGGELEGVAPKVIVVLIGTNNTGADLAGRIGPGGDSAGQVAEGVAAVVGELRRRQPQAHVLLLGIFPRGAADAPVRALIAEVNGMLAGLEEDKVHYLDVGGRFVKEDGGLRPEIMPDGLHLSPEGYAVWADAIGPEVRRLLRE